MLDRNSKTIFLELQEKLDRIARIIHFALTKMTLTAIVISDPVVSAVNYFILDMGEESFILTEPFLYVWQLFFVFCNKICPQSNNFTILVAHDVRLPWNLKRPLGYIIALFMEISGEFCAVFVITALLCFLIGSLYLLKTIIIDITNDLPKLHVKKRPNQNFNNIAKHFKKIVHDFSNAKQLSEYSLVHCIKSG